MDEEYSTVSSLHAHQNDVSNETNTRGIREAIHIKQTNSTLNKDQGRHNLPSYYDKVILSSCDRTATSGHTME